MMLDLLQKSKDSKSLIGLNYYSSDSGFYCGYVLDFNDDFVIIQHFTKNGIVDGILVHKISDIQYFESETVYLAGMIDLIHNQNEILKQTFKYNLDQNSLENFTQLFENFIGNKDYLIKFELSNEDIYFGFIEWCDDESFSIINIDSEGSVIGKAIFRFDDLKLYWIDDMESRRRKVLYAAKQKGK